MANVSTSNLNDNLIKVGSIFPTGYCENACLHCGSGATVQGKPMPFEDINALLTSEQVRLTPNFGLSGGGDPIHYSFNGKKLVHIVEILLARGVKDVTIHTQGWHSDSEECKNFFALTEFKKNILFRISYHAFAGISRERYLDKICTAACECFFSGVRHTIDMLALPKLGKKLNGFMSADDMVSEIYQLLLSRLPVNYGIGNHVERISFLPSENGRTKANPRIPTFERLLAKGAKFNIRPRCTALEEAEIEKGLNIDQSGNVHICNGLYGLRVSVGNVYENDARSINENKQLFLQLMRGESTKRVKKGDELPNVPIGFCITDCAKANELFKTQKRTSPISKRMGAIIKPAETARAKRALAM
ncbi:MAG: hypothetical protein ABIH99_03150 [Candidatus Micrarchaeota archaeon]